MKKTIAVLMLAGSLMSAAPAKTPKHLKARYFFHRLTHPFAKKHTK
jgi:hypothetical protein